MLSAYITYLTSFQPMQWTHYITVCMHCAYTTSGLTMYGFVMYLRDVQVQHMFP